MYFPYLRGRQYELLALRELANDGLLSKKVFPIIEPVKNSSTLGSLIDVYKNRDLPLALIINPKVGDIKDSTPDIIAKFFDKDILPSFIMENNSRVLIDCEKKYGIDINDLVVILNDYDSAVSYRSVFPDEPPKFTLFPDKRDIRRTVKANKVLFEDKFRRKERNVDYLDMIDESFSNDHLYFEEDGYCGFGDYSIVGDYYQEGGQLPYAVAIHIVYFNDSKELRIHHFISDSIEGPEDVAGKYGEAVRKIKGWCDEGKLKHITKALSIFLQHADTGYYPGLPTIKKLSIMHHLELVNRYLNGKI